MNVVDIQDRDVPHLIKGRNRDFKWYAMDGVTLVFDNISTGLSNVQTASMLDVMKGSIWWYYQTKNKYNHIKDR